MRYILGYLVLVLIFWTGIPYVLYQIAGSIHEKSGIEPFRLVGLKIVSVCLLVLTFTWSIWCHMTLVRKGRGGPAEAFGIAVSPKTRALATSGPYVYTRNPMAFGYSFYLFSLSLFFGSPFFFILVLLEILLYLVYFALVEERRLIRDFGDEYMAYRKKTPAFFPWCPRPLATDRSEAQASKAKVERNS